jgi:O-antigen/teichoic acid export membrane protein
MMPFLVNTLGETAYGLWILIGSFTGYFGFLDLGIRTSLGRHLAFHLARRELESINTTLNTALALLLAAGCLALVGTLLLQVLFFAIIDVPVGQEISVRWALALVGLNLAFYFPLQAFDATLWGAQRFDRGSQIEIGVAVLRAGLVLWLVRSGDPLVRLASITLTTTLAEGLLKLAFTLKTYTGLRFSPRLFRWAATRSILGFGFWNFLVSVCQQVITRSPALMIGAFLSPAAVTPYSIAERFVSFTSSFLSAVFGVVSPKSAAYQALNESKRQVLLFLGGSRLCWAAATFATFGLLLFGRDLIVLWLGPKHGEAASCLAILALGAGVLHSQRMTTSVLLGLARYRAVAIISLAHAACTLVATYVAAARTDTEGVCVTIAGISTLVGLAHVWNGCRVFEISWWAYSRTVILPAWAACSVPVAIGFAVHSAAERPLLSAFVAQVLGYSALFALLSYWACLRPLLMQRRGSREGIG